MALFTTTPASEITPIPVITMTNGIWKKTKPNKTPAVDIITDVITIKGLLMELNCDMRINAIRKRAIRNATERKSIDSC